MARIYKVAIDPLPVASPDASEIQIILGAPAKPVSSAAECWYEYDEAGHKITPRTVPEPSTASSISTASSAWSRSSFHSVRKLGAGPSAPPTRSSRLTVIRRRRGDEAKRTTGGIVAAIKTEETIDPQKGDAMRGVQRVQRVVAEPLFFNPSPDGRSPSESEMRDDADEQEAFQLPTITQVTPSSGDEFQISMTPVQTPPPEPDIFDLSTMGGALPHYALGFSSRYMYDFTQMNEALPGHPSYSSSRRSFNPYELTAGSRTQTKVQQIRREGRHRRKD